MNLTDTVDHSWENAVFIDSPDIARGYLDEWVQLFAMSEPLDWRSLTGGPPTWNRSGESEPEGKNRTRAPG